jgi:hypothetical protein
VKKKPTTEKNGCIEQYFNRSGFDLLLLCGQLRNSYAEHNSLEVADRIGSEDCRFSKLQRQWLALPVLRTLAKP